MGFKYREPQADPTFGMETTNQEGVNMEKSNIFDW